MGFRNPITRVPNVDTGAAARRVVITSGSSDPQSGGTVQLVPSSGRAAVIAAGSDDSSDLLILDGPPAAGGAYASQMFLRGPGRATDGAAGGIQLVGSSLALPTVPSATRKAWTTWPVGAFLVESDTGRVLYSPDGSTWRQLPTTQFTQGAVNNGWAGTGTGTAGFGWVPGCGAQLTVPADGVRRDWSADCATDCTGTSGAWWRYRVDLSAGNGKAASTSYWPNANGFHMTWGTEGSFDLQAGGTFLGDQAAACYLEFRADTAAGPNIVIPTVMFRLT